MPVAVVFSGAAATQADVASRIAAGLGGRAWTVQRIDIDGLDDAASRTLTQADAPSIVAAVGPGALAFARRHFPGAAIVFSQVVEPTAASVADASRVDGSEPCSLGVAALPPTTLQFAAWARVDPNLRRIGLIASPKFAPVVPEARRAAAAIGAELIERTSTSDRETLYLFRRLAPSIDGLWLAPDSDVLSASVIEQILQLAAERNVGVLVFADSLLDRGGLISVVAPPAHVAATVVTAMEQIRAGQGTALPAEIPLREGAVRVNPRVAAALGLPARTPNEWVIRDPD